MTLDDPACGEQFGKFLVVAAGKEGKTVKLAADCLGALPGQEHGLVSSPECLHIFPIDTAAVEGLGNFLTETCKKPKSYLAVDVVPLKDEIAKTMSGKDQWNLNFYNLLSKHIAIIREQAVKDGKVHAIIVSSLTGMSETLKRGISGGINPEKKGSGMDMAKWDAYNQCLIDLRAMAQADTHHCFWEGHILREEVKNPEKQNEMTTVEVLQGQGSVAKNWSMNVQGGLRMRRGTEKYPNTNIFKCSYDTRPAATFISNGRQFNERLNAKEDDMAVIMKKLGKRVGGMTG